jgi:hypothetical protein
VKVRSVIKLPEEGGWQLWREAEVATGNSGIRRNLAR